MEIKAEELLYRLEHKQNIEALGHVWAVFGEEDYYRQQIVTAVPEAIFANVPVEDRQICIFDKDTDLLALGNAINTYPFFSGHSLVFLRDEKLLAVKADNDSKKKQLDKLAALLDDVPEYCTVVVSVSKLDKRTKLYKAIKKAGLVCECQSIRPYELGAWLDAQAESYGAHWQRDAIGVIMEYLSPVEKAPLQLLRQEIAKLAVYAGERRTWTKEDVETIFAALPEASNFALLNFIKFRMHVMFQNIRFLYRTEGSKANMECYFCNLHSHISYLLQQLRCKMKTGCRCSCRTVIFCIYSLITVLILQLMRNIRRQWHLSEPVKDFFKNPFIMELDQTIAFLYDIHDLSGKNPLSKDDLCTDFTFFSRFHKGFPDIIFFSFQ